MLGTKKEDKYNLMVKKGFEIDLLIIAIIE